ncbi:MAG: response regulator [Vicinamibacterales bacterium]
MSIRVVLADDHPIVLQGLEQLFLRATGFDVVRCCADGPAALEAVRTLRPDVLLVDLRLPGMNGLEVLRAVRDAALPCRTVLLTAAIRDDEAADAVSLGARGIVLKEASPETLLDCLRRVHEGGRWFAPGLLDGALDRLQHRAPPLTARELEIVRHVAEGLRNREIAGRLSITEGTVKIHLHHIYEKLGVDGRVALVLRAQADGLL